MIDCSDTALLARYEDGRDAAVRFVACRGLETTVKEHAYVYGDDFANDVDAPDADDKAFACGENDALLNMVFAKEDA